MLSKRIGVVGGDPLVHVRCDLIRGKVQVAMGRAVGWVVETICDLKQALVSMLQVGSQLPIFLEGTVQLEYQALEIKAAVQRREWRQCLTDSFQLMVARQPAPEKGLAAAAVDCIPDRLTAFLFELGQFSRLLFR